MLALYILMLCLAALETHVHHPALNPRFLPTKTNISVNVGGTAKLKCRIEDLGPKIVRSALDNS